MSALDTQVGGYHYTKRAIQPFEYSMKNGLDPLQHTIIKYVTRFRDKDGVADLEKAKHCIDMLIEFETPTLDPYAHADGSRECRPVDTLDDWIKWDGGERPVSTHTKVEVELGNGQRRIGLANGYGWLHDNGASYDIIAYRVV